MDGLRSDLRCGTIASVKRQLYHQVFFLSFCSVLTLKSVIHVICLVCLFYTLGCKLNYVDHYTGEEGGTDQIVGVENVRHGPFCCWAPEGQ